MTKTPSSLTWMPITTMAAASLNWAAR